MDRSWKGSEDTTPDMSNSGFLRKTVVQKADHMSASRGSSTVRSIAGQVFCQIPGSFFYRNEANEGPCLAMRGMQHG